MRRRFVAGIRMTRTLPILAMLAMLAVPAAWAQRPPAVVPVDPQLVLERLPRGYAQLMPGTGRQPATLARIERLLTLAAQTGDSRLAARAHGLLARYPADARDPGVLRARAFEAQHRHDFAGAVQSLDRLVAAAPRDGEARLARAQVNLVRGRLDLARGDCVALALGIDAGNGLLCVAMLSLRNGHYPAAGAALDRWLEANAAAADPETRRQALVMRAEIAARAGDRSADRWFRTALALAPQDVRTLAAYARYLRGAGRNREVLTLLSVQGDSDGLRLQRTLAAHRLDPQSAASLVAAQARAFATARAAGIEPELRDEAEFLLVARDQPRAALALALRNFRTQRDHEDVDLLQRAAALARRPNALAQLHAWAASQGLSIAERRP